MNKQSFRNTTAAGNRRGKCRFEFVACLLLVAVCLLSFSRLAHNNFIGLDDPLYITGNAVVQGGLRWDSVVWAFQNTTSGMRLPLTWLSLMLDYQIYGLSYAGFALTNLLLHSASTLVLFLLLSCVTGRNRSSLMVAALFAVHPLHVESVAWISERKDVLYAFFWWLAIWAYGRYTLKPSCLRYAAVMALMAASCLAKPMAVTLPVCLLLLDIWPLARVRLPDPMAFGTFFKHLWVLTREKIPLLVISAAVSFDTFRAHVLTEGMPTMSTLPLSARLANVPVAYVGYLRKMFWPADLAIFYPHPGTELPFWQVIGSLFLLAAITVMVFLVVRRSYLLAGWLWFLIALIPVIGITQAGIQALADRFTYIPLTGLLVMLVWGCAELAGRWGVSRAKMTTAAVAIVILLTLMTMRQVSYWKNDITVFSRAVQITPANNLALINLGSALMGAGRLTEARQHFKEHLRLEPDNALPHYNMAMLVDRMGEPEVARRHYERALEIYPGYVQSHNNLGNLLARSGDFKQAAVHLREAIRLSPRDPRAYNNLGAVYELTQKFTPARENYLKALELDPQFPEALRNYKRLE